MIKELFKNRSKQAFNEGKNEIIKQQLKSLLLEGKPASEILNYFLTNQESILMDDIEYISHISNKTGNIERCIIIDGITYKLTNNEPIHA